MLMEEASISPSLPETVLALAKRLGAQENASGRAEFSQVGTLRNFGQQRWMRFGARQWADARTCAFRWRARVGPLGAVIVEDSLIENVPSGSVKALGLFSLSRAAPTPELLEGAAMRYLAEIPWVPDAILSNPQLQWTNIGDELLHVAAQFGSVSASLTIQLDDNGLPRRIEGFRPAMKGKGFVRLPWYGAFADYQKVFGRQIPHAGSVGWIVDDKPFDVWEGSLTNWRFVKD